MVRAEAEQHGGHPLYLRVQLGEAEDALLIGLGRDVDQRALRCPRGEMAIDGVMAQVGLAADEPVDERRPAVVADGV